MSKQFWAVIAVIVIALVGVFIVTGEKNNTGSGTTASASNNVLGKGTTGVKIVEYGDYQCPYCQTYHATLKQVLDIYGDKISFQFVNFPLTSIHQNAFAASRAAEAAGKQDKYWEMHDLLYETNDPGGRTGWVVSNAPAALFNQYATQLGLNLEKFKTDYASSSVNAAINSDLTKGNKLGVEGTPTFFIDGKKVTISNTVADFQKVIDAEIKKKTTGEGAGATSSGTTEQTTTPTPAAATE